MLRRDPFCTAAAVLLILSGGGGGPAWGDSGGPGNTGVLRLLVRYTEGVFVPDGVAEVALGRRAVTPDEGDRTAEIYARDGRMLGSRRVPNPLLVRADEEVVPGSGELTGEILLAEENSFALLL